MPSVYTRPTVRSGRRRDHAEPSNLPARPYGPWYPLVRLGHFLLMTAASCLIIIVGLGILGAAALVVATMVK